MKKRFAAFVFCFALLFSLLPATAYADVGPKPSVRIRFENLDDEVCYGTLLCSTKSYAAASAWDGNPAHIYLYQDIAKDIWQAFVDYQDSDGYYYLQRAWLCSETKQLNWTYYPPSPFKILLYFPETDTYAVSEIQERYAFDSYFTVTMDGQQISSVRTSYDFTWEIISLVCRIVVTIALELAVAWCFRLREKKQVQTIFWVNVVTQVLLNLSLNCINYYQGSYSFVFLYVLLEFVVFIVEAIIYVVLFRKHGILRGASNQNSAISKGRLVFYSLAANVISFIGGLGIAHVVPGIF